MGWKASVIIINKPTQADNKLLLQELGFSNLTKAGDEPFDVTINPDKNKVYIGSYKDNLLICAPDLPMHFFEDHPTEAEKVLSSKFPDSEICSIILQSTVNLWGYAVTKNGQKLRVRAGSADSGTFIETGEPLEEEKELLARSTIGKDGQRTYIFPDMGDEPMTEAQVGENYVFSICKRYFDEELDQADELLFETILAGYSFGQAITLQENTQETNPGKPVKTSKPWWKFKTNPVNLTGRWKGKYTYRQGYPAQYIGKSEPFEIDIVDKDGAISGTCMDKVVRAKEGNEAYIIGTFNQNRVAFKKRYKFHLVMDESGDSITDDTIKIDGVDYKGKLRKRFFSGRVYFSGEWSITTAFRDENNLPQAFICKGTWKMNRLG